ncbi:MAG: Histone acetyltransferase [Myxococcaceae bacterium]|nr:Histone acetyltransferase [Myxococcaceae bacterium]
MIEIRPARPDDLVQVSKLAAALVRLHHKWDARRFMLIEPLEEGYHRFFGSQLSDGDVVLLVALRAHTIVGYVYGGMEPRNWNALLDRCGAVHDIHVDESVRKQGVASQLMEAACQKLKALGAARVVLMSAEANHEGQRLFEKLGFRRTMVEMTREL